MRNHHLAEIVKKIAAEVQEDRLAMPRLSIIAIVIMLVGLPVALYAWPIQTEEQALAKAHTDLIEVVRIARLQPGAQLRELPHVYKDIWQNHPRVADAGGVDQALYLLDSKVASERPDAFVAQVEALGRYAVPNAVFDLCKNLLGPHAVELAPLIIEGLNSTDRRLQYAAVQLIECAWMYPQKGEAKRSSNYGWLQVTPEQRKLIQKSPMQVFLDPLYDLWMKDLDDTIVVNAAARFQSPRVLEFLVSAVVTGTDRYQYANYLSNLIAHEAPPPALLEALSSPDVRIRRAAAESLYYSGSPVLKPYVKRLALDADPILRVSAAMISFKLSDADWREIQPAVEALGHDSNAEVRGKVTGLMVINNKAGKRLAPDVLKGISDAAMPQLAHIYLYDAMCKIAGVDFGYEEDFRGNNWMPNTLANTAALKRFGAWITAKGQ